MTGGTNDAVDQPTIGQKVAAEVLGTFVLVLLGVGAALMSGGDLAVTGLAFGLAVLVMVAAFGRISGGHFNPAVSVGAVLGGRLAWRDLPTYVGAQLAGGLLAGACLLGLMQGFPGYSAEGNLGQNFFGDQSQLDYAWWAALLLELLLTMVFVWVVLGVTDSRNSSLAALAPIAIGLALAGVHFASVTATGTSVNPARSIGVGVFAGMDAVSQLWLFVLAPLLGGAVAGTTYPLVFGQGAAPVPGSGLARSPRLEQPASPGYGQPAPGSPWGGVAAQPQPGVTPPYGAQPGVQPAPGQPGQWGAPAQQWGATTDPQWQQPPAAPTQTRQPYGQEWGAPQQPPAQHTWGTPPDDDEDGRTQIRPGG